MFASFLSCVSEEPYCFYPLVWGITVHVFFYRALDLVCIHLDNFSQTDNFLSISQFVKGSSDRIAKCKRFEQ